MKTLIITLNQILLRSFFKIGLLSMALFFLCGAEHIQAQSDTLKTQAEVDAFPLTCNCSAFTGNLTIEGLDIVNLDSLYELTSISGNLRIWKSDSLANLDGLANLTSVGQSLTIGLNPLLTQVDGLSNLNSVGQYFLISQNQSLSNLNGLSNLDSVGITLQITNNPGITNTDSLSNLNTIQILAITDMQNLTNIDGLSNLTTMSLHLYIFNNDSLKNINALSNINSLSGDVRIYNNKSLTNLDGLSGLNSIGGYLFTNNNSSLTNMDGLSTLNSVGGYLTIQNNSLLSACCPIYDLINGLNGKSVTGSISISNNNTGCDSQAAISIDTDGDNIADCLDNCPLAIDGIVNFDTLTCDCEAGTIADTTVMNGQTVIASCIQQDYILRTQGEVDSFPLLCNCTSIPGNLSIGLGGTVENLDSLYQLTSVNGNLRIANTSNLESIDGLSNLNYVGGFLELVNLGNVDNLDAFSNLQGIGSYLVISYNDNLLNINGLSNITSLDSFLIIGNNPNLADINGLSNMETLTGGLAIAQNNALKNVDALSNIESVNGEVQISFNDSLEDINGLDALVSIEGDLVIGRNPTLTNLDGLISLSSVDGNLEIGINDGLVNIEGLTNLDSVLGDFSLRRNTQLAECCVLYDLLNSQNGKSIGGSIIISENNTSCDNPAAINNCEDADGDGVTFSDGDCDDNNDTVYPGAPELCDSLDNDCNGFIDDGVDSIFVGDVLLSTQAAVNAWPSCYTQITGNLIIMGADINNLDSLYRLTSIGDHFSYVSLRIQYNDLLTNIDGLSNLQCLKAGGLNISNNNLLKNINALSNLDSVGSVDIFDNNSLENIDGLTNLKSTKRHLEISHNNSLTNIDGLANFKFTGGYLIIWSNNTLKNLDGLYGLDSVPSYIDIQANDLLESIEGLSNLKFVTDLQIHRNPLLTECCPIYELINGLNGKMVVNDEYVYIADNNTGCDSVSEVNDECGDPDNDGCIGADDPHPNIPSGDSDTDGTADDCDPVFNIDIWVNNTVLYIEDSLNLNGGNTRALTGKLYDAFDKYCNGKVNQALNKLKAFKNQVTAFENRGDISASEAAFLIAAADALIAAINDGTVECPVQALLISGNNDNPANPIVFDLGLKVYPNPSSGEVNILFKASEKKSDVLIYDLYGKLVWSEEIDDKQISLNVDLSSGQFGTGIYIVCVSNETGTQAQRVVVNR